VPCRANFEGRTADEAGRVAICEPGPRFSSKDFWTESEYLEYLSDFKEWFEATQEPKQWRRITTGILTRSGNAT
jgi:hypothetical protein